MSEQQLQFRVGLFAIIAMAICSVLTFKFGSLKDLLDARYEMAIHFKQAPGLFPSTPVRMNGITIGSVKDVSLDQEQGGVLVTVNILQKYQLRADSTPSLKRSLLGDSSIEFTPGVSPQFLLPNSRLTGLEPMDPMDLVNRMEEKVSLSLASIEKTSNEWGKVGSNLNQLMLTNRGQIDEAIAQAAVSLKDFSQTMQNTNKVLVNAETILGDPENQANLKRTLAAMPKMVEETHQTINLFKQTVSSVQGAVAQADKNLENLTHVTEPLGKRTASIVTKLDGTMTNMHSLSKELNVFIKLMAKEEGTIHKLAADPELYENLNRSAAAMNVLLYNLQPIMKDVRIFSDKIARHPELMGVSGAMKGSSGVKESSYSQPQNNSAIQRTSGRLPSSAALRNARRK